MVTNKGLSRNTASSYCIGAGAFFSYFELELKLKGKIPDTSMKIDVNVPTLENLQTMFRLGDLQTKALLSIMRDCPARVGDPAKKVIPRMTEGTFLIESEKELVPGRCYLSDMTVELGTQLQKSGLELPETKRGISKMLERICNIAGIPVFNPQIMRKIFFDTGCNLNINRDILRVLMFKSVSKDILTYLLSRNELREAWQQIINALPLEKANGKVSSLQEALDLVMKVQRKQIEKELQLQGYNIPSQGMGLIVKKTDREILEEYLES